MAAEQAPFAPFAPFTPRTPPHSTTPPASPARKKLDRPAAYRRRQTDRLHARRPWPRRVRLLRGRVGGVAGARWWGGGRWGLGVGVGRVPGTVTQCRKKVCFVLLIGCIYIYIWILKKCVWFGLVGWLVCMLIYRGFSVREKRYCNACTSASCT